MNLGGPCNGALDPSHDPLVVVADARAGIVDWVDGVDVVVACDAACVA
jgi:hypothetical protein